jgi:predicted membrane protein
MIAFLVIFSFLGIFVTIFLIYVLRAINQIKVQFDNANEKIGTFKESVNVISKSIDIFRSIFGNAKNNNNKE